MKIKFTTESGVTKYLKLGISSVLGLQDILDTKSDTDHIHSEYALTTHNHSISEVTGLQAALDNKAASNHNHDTSYADISHNHDTSYAGINHNHDATYAKKSHSHEIAEVEGLQAELDSKASATHSHSYNDLDDKPTIPVVPDIELNDSTETSGKYKIGRAHV